MRLWGYAAAAAAAIVGCAGTVAPAAAAASPPNGGPVTVMGGTSPAQGRLGTGSGRVGTIFTLTPVKGGCPHANDLPFVRWNSPAKVVALVSTPGNRTGSMATGATAPGKPAAKPGTYSAQLECLATTADHHTRVDKVFSPASITLTGFQLLPSLSRTLVPAGGKVHITLPGYCSRIKSPLSSASLVAPDGKFVTLLKSGDATMPTSVAPGRYFVSAQCFSGSATHALSPGYAYGFAGLYVLR